MKEIVDKKKKKIGEVRWKKKKKKEQNSQDSGGNFSFSR